MMWLRMFLGLCCLGSSLGDSLLVAQRAAVRSHSEPATLLRADRTALAVQQRLRGGGSVISRLLPILLNRKQCKILMLGLDAAGKTTILYQLKLGEMATTTPTLGVNVESITYKNIEFTVMDMGGQDKLRQLWQHYYEGTEALIFVVDSADEERLVEAKNELQKLMKEETLKDALLLVYANKQDLPEALSMQAVADGLEITEIKNRVWYIQACSAQSGDGLTEGLEWLVGRIAAKMKQK